MSIESVNPRLDIPVQRDRFADDRFQRQVQWLAAVEDRTLDRGRQDGKLCSGADVGVRMARFRGEVG